MSARRDVFPAKVFSAESQQIEQRALALVLGFLARSFPTYLQRLIVGVADAPFPLRGITLTFGYDQFERQMMAQQNAPCVGTLEKMKGAVQADLKSAAAAVGVHKQKVSWLH
jgi:hypothetical protein